MFEECDPKEVRRYGKLTIFTGGSIYCLEKKADYTYIHDPDNSAGLEINVKKGEEIVVSGLYGSSLVIPYDMNTNELLKDVDKIAKQNPDDLRGVFLNITRFFDAGEVYPNLPTSVVEKLFALNLYFRLNKDRFE